MPDRISSMTYLCICLRPTSVSGCPAQVKRNKKGKKRKGKFSTRLNQTGRLVWTYHVGELHATATKAAYELHVPARFDT